MAVFRAYYDASGVETQEGHLVVIGLAATEQKWGKFERLWNAALAEYGLTHHHHKDYVHSRHEYATWEGDAAKRKAYLARMIRCLKLGMNKGYVATVSNTTIKAVNAKYVWGKGDGSGAYLITADTCRKWIEHFVHTQHPGSEIHHIFEKGDRGQDWLPDLLRMKGRNNGFSILPKKDPVTGTRLRELEGADLVAWEIKRAMDDLEGHRGRPARGALRELGKMLPLAGAPLTTERLMEICDNAPAGVFEKRR